MLRKKKEKEKKQDLKDQTALKYLTSLKNKAKGYFIEKQKYPTPNKVSFTMFTIQPQFF